MARLLITPGTRGTTPTGAEISVPAEARRSGRRWVLLLAAGWLVQAGQTAQQSWPNAPAGWRIVASDQTYEWVAWRAP